jgi:phosphohistidine phosphatase
VEIHILRHAIADPARPGEQDADRAVTPEGRKKLREVLRVAKAAGLAPGLILTSPYRRAIETAEMAASQLNFTDPPLATNALLPGSNAEDVWEEIRVHKDAQEILLVGHEPLLGQLAGYLLGTPSLLIDFKKGALVRIDMDQFSAKPRGVLRWFFTPKLASKAG